MACTKQKKISHDRLRGLPTLESAALVFPSSTRLELHPPTLPPTLHRDIRLLQRNRRIHPLAHIVDSKRRNRRRRESLDIHTCFVVSTRTRLDSNHSLLTIKCKLQVDMRHGQWMAERNNLRRLFGRHNTGDLGHFQHAPL